MMSVGGGSMFRVAFPTIRAGFAMPADLTAWIDSAYELAYLILMPVYGRLADQLGKRRLFQIGILLFLAGTALIALSPGLRLLFVGRILQGAGTSGIHPLCIAVISDAFTPENRGDALGRWNSFGTVAAMAGPLIGGLLIDALGWRAILAPMFAAGVAALFVVRRRIPDGPRRIAPLDWQGLVLYALGLTLFVFFVSSRPVTGVAPLRDVRLLAGAVVFLGLFVARELTAASPLITLSILRFRNFAPASLCSGLRMFLFGGFGILLPLYLAEVHGLEPTAIGLLLTGHFVALLLTMRWGGVLSDSFGSRWLIAAGTLVQAGALAALSDPGIAGSLVSVMVVLVVHGLGAGVYLAPVHRAAMAGVPGGQRGAAAGLYSVLRYSGSLLGPAVAGILLEAGLQAGPSAAAYRTAFAVIALAGLLAVPLAITIRDRPEPVRR